MEDADNMRTNENLSCHKRGVLKHEKSPAQIDFESLLSKVKRSDFYEFYIQQECREKRRDAETRFIKQKIEKHMQRNTKNVFDEHLSMLKKYCDSKQIDYERSMPDFILEDLHPNREVALELQSFFGKLRKSIEE